MLNQNKRNVKPLPKSSLTSHFSFATLLLVVAFVSFLILYIDV